MADDNQQEPVQPTIEDRLAKLEADIAELKNAQHVLGVNQDFHGDRTADLEVALDKAGIRIPVEPEPKPEPEPEEPETLTAVA